MKERKIFNKALSNNIPECYCPWCGELIDRMTDSSFKGARPKEGDLSICICCAGISIINSNLSLVCITEYDLSRLEFCTLKKLEEAHSQVLKKVFGK